MAATEAAALLTLVQWLSPAFPVGSFAYSQGLEWAIAAGDITTAADLERWLAAVLAHGAGRSDAVLLALALRRNADHTALGAVAQALAPSRERFQETMAQGGAFAATTNALTGGDLPAMAYPVAVGAAARGLGLAPQDVVALWLQAAMQALVQAAVRFVPLGQTEGQAVLAGLVPLTLRVAAQAVASELEDIGSAALRADLAGMRHETMDVRIFRT